MTPAQQRKYAINRARTTGTLAKGVLANRVQDADTFEGMPFVAAKSLTLRKLTLEAPFKARDPGQIAKALRASGQQAEVMEMVAEIVRDQKLPRSGGSLDQLMQKHLALNIAASLLNGDAAESDWLLIAASMKGRIPTSRKALLQRLEEGDADEASFSSLFEPARESGASARSLRDMKFAARRNPRLLNAVLRQAMGLNNVQAYRRTNIDAEQLSRDILACGQNPDLLTALADSLEGIQGSPVQHAQMLKSLRGDGRKLARLWLRAHEAASAANAERVELRMSVQEATRDLELLDGDAIRGRYNALDAAVDGPDPALFLEAYQEVTSEESTQFTAVLRNMLKFYALEEVNGQLDRTKKALGDDLRAEKSSGDKAHLSEILTSMGSMHLSSSFLMMVEEFETRLAGAAASAGVTLPEVNGKMLVLGLIDIIESGSSQPAQFEALLAKLGLDRNPWTVIVTMQGIKEIMRTMPERIYASVKALGKLQEAAQTVLEAAILREEESAPAA